MADPFWLATAKTLAAGRHTKIECCANDKSLQVSNDPRGYRAYCYRCGPRGFVKHGDFSIDALRRRREELALVEQRTVSLPKDFTTEIPASEAVWLYKAGISHDLASHYGFGYSPYLRRVVLPIYLGDALQGFVARSTINAKPKYIEKMVQPSEAIFIADPGTRLPASEDWPVGSGPDAVFTEDILSAVRVGRHVRTSCALLGTSANVEQYAGIASNCNSVAVWFDPDKAGVKARKKLARSLQLRGHEVRVIKTSRDPKYYSNREIRSILSST